MTFSIDACRAGQKIHRTATGRSWVFPEIFASLSYNVSTAKVFLWGHCSWLEPFLVQVSVLFCSLYTISVDIHVCGWFACNARNVFQPVLYHFFLFGGWHNKQTSNHLYPASRIISTPTQTVCIPSYTDIISRLSYACCHKLNQYHRRREFVSIFYIYDQYSPINGLTTWRNTKEVHVFSDQAKGKI